MLTIILVIVLGAGLFYIINKKKKDVKNKKRRPIKKGTSTNITSEDPSNNQNGEDV